MLKKFSKIHQPDEMLYNFETIRKSYPVLVDGVTLEYGRRMSLNGHKFFELTRSLKIKGTLDVKKALRD